MSRIRTALVLCVVFIAIEVVAAGYQNPAPVNKTGYFPSRDSWERRKPAEVGMDEALLAEAVAYAQGQEATNWPKDFSAQIPTFGRPLGPVPKDRASVNGVILRHGYIVAEFGDTLAVDPTYSVAKSYLSTILGLTIDRGMIKSVKDPVRNYIKDGGYDSPHNSKITWEHHATQTSEWEGTMFGKPHTFVGKEEFGNGEMRPKELVEPGTRYEYNDVRINRFSLSMLRLWKRSLPDVLKTEIMDPIGASSAWVYHGYDNSAIDIDGKMVKSVSGGTRWGGGLWMSTRDHARFGYLISRYGKWNGKQIISEAWIREGTKPQSINKAYGYLWWLNTESRWPAAPANSFSAQGNGSNTIWIDPQNDLVVVWRWHRGGQPEFYKRILASIKGS